MPTPSNRSMHRHCMMRLKQLIILKKKWIPPKFDETVELAVNLNVDPKYADQQVRGALVLPHGIGKTKRVLVFCTGRKKKRKLKKPVPIMSAATTW